VTPADPDLAAIVRAWPSLPTAVRTGIVATVRAVRGSGEGDDEPLLWERG